MTEAQTIQIDGVVITHEPVDSSDEQYARFCESYRRREDTLTLVHQLNQMVKAVQKHRGISMGLLGGNAVFEGDFVVLQHQLERRLATLETFASSVGGILSDKDKENLHLAWVTIRQNWQDDDLSDNFELHSHFIEQLQGMVYSLAKQLEKPLTPELVDAHDLQADEDDSNASYPRMFKQIEVLNFVAKQLPDMIEQIAKVRGLGTYAAATGLVDYPHDRKLRFLLQCSRQQSEKLRHQAERLESIVRDSIPGLGDLKNLELKLMFLLNTIDKDVLSGTTITASSHQLFKLATDLIDVYWNVVNQGLALVRRWHEDDLEAWLRLAD
ncbi:lytic murein transglycosylase [Saccharophagus degradans]|uniref:Lytic murein transglycosylase n=1 Tax=Saccharophagus degradans TaxID=86304 RepID=A0AAW7XBY6_9GAMM|nr:lytic murein transglycosylase [Saccharophagus degradans]MDO6424441.1 lytic murein transglycosylase [Saccharophagus degradans]MDO6608352.1 lytic murein transglycosylase [Saccharophagus degradans]WGO99253.1 lytic murein transglycosylase [Saccharophagus degradans]